MVLLFFNCSSSGQNVNCEILKSLLSNETCVKIFQLHYGGIQIIVSDSGYYLTSCDTIFVNKKPIVINHDTIKEDTTGFERRSRDIIILKIERKKGAYVLSVRQYFSGASGFIYFRKVNKYNVKVARFDIGFY